VGIDIDIEMGIDETGTGEVEEFIIIISG